MTHHIEIREYNIPRPNGDRARCLVDCYDFAIIVNGVQIHRFSQYDPFHCSVQEYDMVLRTVHNMTDKLADAIACVRPDKPIRYIERRIARTEWVPI